MNAPTHPEPAALDGETIALRWRASFTRRWHANTDLCDTHDPVSGHQCRVALLMLALKPDVSRAALIAALTHDQGEAGVGDMAAPFKRANPEVALALSIAEAGKLAAQGIADEGINDGEAALLSLCDRLDGFLWMVRHRPDLADRCDWQQADRDLDLLADECGVPTSTLDGLIAAIER